jgi:hypothetical protein
MKKSFVLVAIVAMALVFGGCAKVPQAELDAANAAIEKAKVAEANLYLETEFSALMDSMNVYNAEIEAKKGKLFKNLNDVKAKLVTVESQATGLVAKTEARKEEIKQEVNAAVAQLQTLATENAGLVEKAPRGKEGKAAVEAIKSELAVVDASAAEIPALLESGNLLGAQAKAKAAVEKATSLNEELKAVIEKYKR